MGNLAAGCYKHFGPNGPDAGIGIGSSFVVASIVVRIWGTLRSAKTGMDKAMTRR
jgi:hypothetical protein